MVTTLLSTAQTLGGTLRRGVADLNADQANQPFRPRGDYYDRQEAYYNNTVFDRWDALAGAYKNWYGLPRHIRPIYNPTRRCVDWYPGHVYPGAEGAIPFKPETAEELRLVVAQAFAWANWKSERYAYVRTGAKLGDVFGEVEVNMERAKVYPRLHHPAFVTNLEWNATGDVTMYRLDIPQVDPQTKRAYKWGKIVTRESITTLYDGEPRGYDGQPAEIENEFGFVPAVWVQHRNVGGQHGAPAIDGVHGKIDELNGIAAAIDDFIQKFIEQGIVFATDKSAKEIVALGGQQPQAPTSTLADPHADRQRIRYLKGPADLKVMKLIENLGLGEAIDQTDKLLREIEKDLPETVLDEQLRAMSQVTGPGAMAMVSDVVNKLDEAEVNYDAGVVKFGQMCAAIGGHLANSGQWGVRSRLTRQQQLFLPFSLESYARGELDFALEPRPLLPETDLQRAQAAAAREALKSPTALREVGYSDDEIYGENQAPAVRPGILAERASQQSDVAGLFGRAFNGA